MNYHKKVEQLLPTLTIEEKVGQLFILAFAGEDTDYALDLIKNYHVGGFYITDDNAHSLVDAKKLSTKLQQQASLRACDASLLLAVDQEGAWGILTQETDLGPGNLALGIVNELSATENIYQVFAEQMQYIGYNTLLSPCADVNSNPNNPIIGQRSFGEQPLQVSEHVGAAVTGIIKTGNLACAKHFPGHGDTETDSHRTLPVVNKSLIQLTNEDLLPFKQAIAANVSLIMTAHINYPKIDEYFPATLSKTILTDILKEQLGFKGLIITDSMNMWAMRKHYSPSVAAILAIKAGAHLVMLSEEHYENEATPYKQIQQETIQGVINAVQCGEISQQQIDQTLKHVLSFKYQYLETQQLSIKHSKAESQKLSLNLADKAIKVLKNDHHLFPLKQQHFFLSFATNPIHYEKLVNSRGIGPNDPNPASQVFTEQLTTLNANFTIVSYQQMTDILNGNSDYPFDSPLVLLTEDYPLPGEDFDQINQLQRIKDIQQKFNEKLLILALRSDYELAKLSDVHTYICAYSSRVDSAKSLANSLIKNS